MYTPPFTITSRIVNLVADISAKTERYAMLIEQDTSLRLRKANRIKTIHSSLAIEGNTLSEAQVRDIINGRDVIAPMREIQEVKNAMETYELFPSLDPFEKKDLLRAHQCMMKALMDKPGRWRTGGVGVFGETGLVHMAPPAHRVPMLMQDLFDWLKSSDDHLLIRSCVFHYEFEFIHPFVDGNGRMGRLWQSLILSKLHPLFAHLPVENMVYSSQQTYYNAIAAATAQGESTPFIQFMLSEILAVLTRNQSVDILAESDCTSLYVSNGGSKALPNNVPNILPNNVPNIFPEEFRKRHPSVAEAVWHVGSLLSQTPKASADQIGAELGMTGRTVRNHIAKLRQMGIAERIGSNKTGYWKIDKGLLK